MRLKITRIDYEIHEPGLIGRLLGKKPKVIKVGEEVVSNTNISAKGIDTRNDPAWKAFGSGKSNHMPGL